MMLTKCQPRLGSRRS